MAADLNQIDLVVGGRFRLLEYVAGGSFGEVFMATDLQKHKIVAVKLEPKFENIDPSSLGIELNIYRALVGGVGMPEMYWFGEEGDYRVMAVELLGPTLYDLLDYVGNKFSLKTVLMIADQLICRLRFMHSRKILHQDVTAGNVIMGTGRKGNCVYLTDFGCAARYFEDPSKADPYDRIGTDSFASLSAHAGRAQCPRDDLESLGFLLLFLLGSKFPWNDYVPKSPLDQDKIWKDIGQIKNDTTIETLCEGVPHAFLLYFRHVRSLQYHDRPDYSYLRSIFRELFVESGFEYDHVYDWTAQLFESARTRRQEESDDSSTPPTDDNRPIDLYASWRNVG
ncbi:protein kinase-like protein [Aspergillus taichungensis]|uniref:EKC/KEOPS complex subunit BUD32 n=1 Tax=Aspergillus taichungensis TaxID=482145 RepID=A0A2J5HWB3_9EURO|nr:protein kinase-like protein [Aspergillus taichungensis]